MMRSLLVLAYALVKVALVAALLHDGRAPEAALIATLAVPGAWLIAS